MISSALISLETSLWFFLSWLSLINIALMLSFPNYLSYASYNLHISHSNISYNILHDSYPFFILLSTNYWISNGDFSSHMPSQPINIYSISSRFYLRTYGSEITICFLWGSLLLFLKSISPIALDTFKQSFIRPYSLT